MKCHDHGGTTEQSKTDPYMSCPNHSAYLYVFLSTLPFIFRRTSFNPRVRKSPPPDRNDRTTLPITNRNPIYYNPVMEVFPPLNLIPTTRHCCIVLLNALFPLDAAVTTAVEVEESQYMCPSSRQARCTVKPS